MLVCLSVCLSAWLLTAVTANPLDNMTCEQMFNDEECSRAEFREGVDQMNSKEITSRIVREGIFEALAEAAFEPATVAYGAAAPNWLCDSAIIKQVSGNEYGSTFEYGETCEAVTGNIRSLVTFTKEKEMATKAEETKTKNLLLSTNQLLVKDVAKRDAATTAKTNAQRLVAAYELQVRSKQAEVHRLQNEVNRLQQQINRDSRDWFKRILAAFGQLLGHRDNRQRDVNNKINEMNQKKNQVTTYQNQVRSFQNQVNTYTRQVNTLKVKIAASDKQIKSLGQKLTELRNIIKDLQVIAMEWEALDDGCEDVEEDMLLFEDLTLAVQTKVEEQAIKLSSLICGNAIG